MSGAVSVVLPTLGRPQLATALASVRAQELAPAEVLVVDDGSGPPADVGVADGLPVRLLRTGGGRGAAAARNLGMRHAVGDVVALLDDDDEWLPGHLAHAVDVLRARPEVDLFASRAVVRSAAAERVEPTVVHDDLSRTLLDFSYGRTSWAGRRRRIMTPTLVVRAAVARLPMDESMTVREDTWWLLTAEQAGHRLWQSDRVTVLVRQDDARVRARTGLEDEVEWARRLDRLAPGYGLQYLVGTTARRLAREGDVSGLAALVGRIHGYGTPLPRDLRAVLLLERLVARALRARAGGVSGRTTGGTG